MQRISNIATVATLTCASTALAQLAITIEVDDPVLMPGESTVVTLLGGYDAPDFAVAGIATSLVTSVGSEGWGDAMVLSPMSGPGTSAGVPGLTGIDGIVAGQLQFAGAGIAADPTNPIRFWQATYTAPTDLLVPFEIDLSTMTSRYDVYLEIFVGTSESRLDDLTEGAATIRVIPAPASALILALGACAVRRRR